VGLKTGPNGAPTAVVATVQHGHPAERIGIRPGDRIVAVNGKRARRAEDVTKAIRASHGAPLRLTVRRGDHLVELPRARARKDVGEPLGPAIGGSLRLVGTVTKAIGSTLVHIVDRHRDVSSALGTVQASSNAAKQGWRDFVFVQALISLSLALLNLLPLLPLDGGHIAFSIIEGVRRRALAREVYERVSAIGIALVLLLFFVGLSNDVGRIGGG
jgi:regulator of sigma E protease